MGKSPFVPQRKKKGASKKYGKMTFKYREYSNNGLEKTGGATVLKNSWVTLFGFMHTIYFVSLHQTVVIQWENGSERAE